LALQGFFKSNHRCDRFNPHETDMDKFYNLLKLNHKALLSSFSTIIDSQYIEFSRALCASLKKTEFVLQRFILMQLDKMDLHAYFSHKYIVNLISLAGSFKQII
jgi:hypothetical protein